jgi:hypothetical protein
MAPDRHLGELLDHLRRCPFGVVTGDTAAAFGRSEPTVISARGTTEATIVAWLTRLWELEERVRANCARVKP